ncbi:hypothetical protein ACJJI5_11570 [Microbulbifer sp. EKSA008]|uniref:hypothetical protein n=1 Tax=Microbulbifer sp. EKSA008 TaxID=3243367 RepID=UPI004041B30E
MSSRESSRVLGPEEALFTELARRTCGGTLLVSFYKVLIPLSVEQLKTAFSLIHEIYPLLQARVESAEQLRWYCDVPFEDIPIEIKELSTPINIEYEYTRRGKTGLNVEACTYTLSFYLNSLGKVDYISMVSNHAALDGRSAGIIFYILDLYFLDQGRFRLDRQPLYDPVETYFDSSKHFSNQQTSGIKENLFKWPVEEAAFVTERQGHVLYRKFPMEELSHVATIGRKHKVRPSALFCAIAIQASNILPNHREWIKILLPMDVRDLCGTGIELSVIGTFSAVTTLEVTPDIDIENTWELAKHLQIELDRQAESGEYCKFNFHKNYDLGNIIEWVEKYETNNPYFLEGLCVSNLGNLESLGVHMNFFEPIIGTSLQTHGAHPISLSTYSTEKSSVFVFSYCDPLTKRNNALNFAEKYINTLKNLI